MSYFRLLNERSVERALQALMAELATKQVLGRLPDLAHRIKDFPEKVELEGFDLFTTSQTIKPYAWFLPKPKVSAQEFLRVYDSFVNHAMNNIEEPGEYAGRIYPRGSEERRIFTRFKAHDQWKSPALLLLAASQHFGSQVQIEDGTVKATLGNGVMGVNDEGCWSLSRGGLMPSEVADFDPEHPSTTFPAVVTDNPVLRCLWELAGHSVSRFAVTAAAHALNEDIINKAFLVKIAKLEAPVAARAATKLKDPAKAKDAFDRCCQVLDDNGIEMIQELAEMAVPHLVSYKQFQHMFGSPTQVTEGRRVRPKTIELWRSKLHTAMKEATGAI